MPESRPRCWNARSARKALDLRQGSQMARVILYHGTRRRSVLVPRERHRPWRRSRSGLGVYLSEIPASAAEHALLPDGGDAPAGRVLVVESEVSNAFVVNTSQFFSILSMAVQPVSKPTSPRCVSVSWPRSYDCVVTDSSLGEHSGIWCVLDPSRLRIIGDDARPGRGGRQPG